MDSWNKRRVNLDNRNSLPEPPPAVINWLAGLYLLNDIPLGYLVPHEKLLPPETICFFHVDLNWLQALTDGALSLGRNSQADAAIDRGAQRETFSAGRRQAPGRRPARRHPSRHHLPLQRDAALPDTPMTGFVLRSRLVRHWRGIEVQGFQASAVLDIQRMEAVENEILLCLFNGVVDCVRFQEPAESLHFGVKRGDRMVPVRAVEGKVGELIGKSVKLEATDSGRIKIREFATGVANSLDPEMANISSAEVALQLLCVADLAVIRASK